jgi:beta-galactosidase
VEYGSVPTNAAAANRPPAAATAATAHTIGYDSYSYLVDGRRVYLWSGEFHYFRLPSPDLWRDVLTKMKAAGFNAASIYFDWAYHCPKAGVYDFAGVRDVDKLLTIAADVGIYVIARPGPYINAEVDSGRFPGWLTTQKGRARSADADSRVIEVSGGRGSHGLGGWSRSVSVGAGSQGSGRRKRCGRRV